MSIKYDPVLGAARENDLSIQSTPSGPQLTGPGGPYALLSEAEGESVKALVSRSGTPNGGTYLGAFPKRLRGGTFGRKVASWGSALQNSAGTTSFEAAGLPPWVDNATRVLVLTQNATASFGQQNPIDGAQAFVPKFAGSAPSAGVWVKNPGSRTLNFELRFFNPAANRACYWTGGACDPAANFPETNGWVFITFSPAQVSLNTMLAGQDGIAFVRVSQVDTGPEGAWLPGEQLKFGNVYVNPYHRPTFCLTFDDGLRSQRYPASTQRVSGAAFVTSVASNVYTTGAVSHGLQVGEPLLWAPNTAAQLAGIPAGLVLGVTYYVRTTPSTTTFTLATDATLATQVVGVTDGSFNLHYQYGGSQDRSIQQIVESYGFRGSLFVVADWIGTTGQYGYGGGSISYLSGADIRAMWDEGWAVGSHSKTHPSNNENAGLRLLGPYGYFLSNTVDNLPAAYVAAWGLGATNRRRVISSTQASPSVFSCENAHRFLVNNPIVFTDVAPTGCTLGVTYYVASIPSSTTFTLATNQGVLTNTVNNTTGAWSGTANYRWAGSANDDSAIYSDAVAGAEAVLALGIGTGYTFMALPQGAADQYVRSALIRGGFKWVRGISGATGVHTIPVGRPSGGGLTAMANQAGGWMGQLDAVQTDGALTLAQITGYVDNTITMGACGCSYHHDSTVGNTPALDRLCAYLKTRSDSGAIDVVTLDELGRGLGLL